VSHLLAKVSHHRDTYNRYEAIYTSTLGKHFVLYCHRSSFDCEVVCDSDCGCFCMYHTLSNVEYRNLIGE